MRLVGKDQDIRRSFKLSKDGIEKWNKKLNINSHDDGKLPIVVNIDESPMISTTLRECIKSAFKKDINDVCVMCFVDIDSAAEYIINNSNRIQMVLFENFRVLNSNIISTLKLSNVYRTKPANNLFYFDDFAKYILDAYCPEAMQLHFCCNTNKTMNAWQKIDPRIFINGTTFYDNKLTNKIKKIWKSRSSIYQNNLMMQEVELINQLSQELSVLCAVSENIFNNMSPRKFEELIASIFKNQGFNVELTQKTKDGGYDIRVVEHSSLSKKVGLIEVKHFSPNRPVSVGLVRELYGVKEYNNADYCILATSSYVTDYAKKEFSRAIPWSMNFLEREDILNLCRKHTKHLIKQKH